MTQRGGGAAKQDEADEVAVGAGSLSGGRGLSAGGGVS